MQECRLAHCLAWERAAHNPEGAGSNPGPANSKSPGNKTVVAWSTGPLILLLERLSRRVTISHRSGCPTGTLGHLAALGRGAGIQRRSVGSLTSSHAWGPQAVLDTARGLSLSYRGSVPSVARTDVYTWFLNAGRALQSHAESPLPRRLLSRKGMWGSARTATNPAATFVSTSVRSVDF